MTGHKTQAPDKTAAPAIGVHLLTRQERAVAELAAQSLSMTEIGKRLFMSPHTAKCHLTRIYAKLNIRNRVQLHQLLVRDGQPVPDRPPKTVRTVEDIAQFLAATNLARKIGAWDHARVIVQERWNVEYCDNIRAAYRDEANRLVGWLGVEPAPAATGI